MAEPQQLPPTITILKLLNGEEIIGKVNEYDSHFEVIKPLQLFKVPDKETGQLKIGMAEYCPYGHDTIAVIRTAVGPVIIPKQELAEQYCEIVGDIILPSKQIITG